MPSMFDPYGYANEALFACVYLDEAGKVLNATLLGRAGSPQLEEALLHSVLNQWRFSIPTERQSPAWHRVRLDAAPGRNFAPLSDRSAVPL